MLQLNDSRRYFLLGSLILCFLYFGLEIFLNQYTMISVDEFWFAHRIYEYKSGLPYRDFAPYKTVLGYYLLLIPMLFSHGILPTLVFTKNVIAACNSIILFYSAWWLRRYFSSTAILISLSLLLFSEIVLSYSTNIRVDLIAYWFCFFSFIFLLQNRVLLAGLLLGLGFITSQKAIWYLFASNIALGAYWLLLNRNRQQIIRIIQFNLMTGFIITLYLALWSAFTNWQTVLHNVFTEASAMYQLDWYDQSRKIYWHYITLYNPLLFLLWPLTLISLAISYSNDRHYHQRFLITIYACVILCCLIPYKQVFPYYMQVTIPIFLFLYAAFFDWLFHVLKSKEKLIFLIPSIYLWIGLTLYVISLILAVIKLELPLAYLLLATIPIAIGWTIRSHQTQLSTVFLNLVMISVIFTGYLYPGFLFSLKISVLNGDYQKANLIVMNELLNDGSDYVAGIELIYNKNQPIPGMRHLMGPAIDYLYAPSEKIRPVMLASLYEDPNATTRSVIKAWKASSVKFYVNNYRMMALPPQIKDYLTSQYEHLWGSIYIYAPEVSLPFTVVEVKFSGDYLIESDKKGEIQLSGKMYPTHHIIHLEKGVYISKAKMVYRLKLQPKLPDLDEKFQKDDWIKIIF